MSDTNPYAGYSDKLLADTHAYWMSIIRAAKNPAQRARAERGAERAAAVMRERRASSPEDDARSHGPHSPRARGAWGGRS